MSDDAAFQRNCLQINGVRAVCTNMHTCCAFLRLEHACSNDSKSKSEVSVHCAYMQLPLPPTRQFCYRIHGTLFCKTAVIVFAAVDFGQDGHDLCHALQIKTQEK